jgi:hypothetical protein
MGNIYCNDCKWHEYFPATGWVKYNHRCKNEKCIKIKYDDNPIEITKDVTDSCYILNKRNNCKWFEKNG